MNRSKEIKTTADLIGMEYIKTEVYTHDQKRSVSGIITSVKAFIYKGVKGVKLTTENGLSYCFWNKDAFNMYVSSGVLPISPGSISDTWYCIR